MKHFLKRLPRVFVLTASAFFTAALLSAQGRMVRSKDCDERNPEKVNHLVYTASQMALAQLDAQKTEKLLELKSRAVVEDAPCVDEFKAQYSDGYAAGHAYFTMTRRWLIYHGMIEKPSFKNAYLAGWLDGQAQALQECAQRGSHRIINKDEKDVDDDGSDFMGDAEPLYYDPYFQEVRYQKGDHEFGPDDFYSKTRQRLASMSDEQKENMAREKAAVAVGEAPDSCALFPEVYRAAYAEGYAFCIVSRELFHPLLIIYGQHKFFCSARCRKARRCARRMPRAGAMGKWLLGAGLKTQEATLKNENIPQLAGAAPAFFSAGLRDHRPQRSELFEKRGQPHLCGHPKSAVAA
jgi:hypothetical protein